MINDCLSSNYENLIGHCLSEGITISQAMTLRKIIKVWLLATWLMRRCKILLTTVMDIVGKLRQHINKLIGAVAVYHRIASV